MGWSLMTGGWWAVLGWLITLIFGIRSERLSLNCKRCLSNNFVSGHLSPFISFSLLIPCTLPFFQALFQNYMIISNINWESLVGQDRLVLREAAPKEHWPNRKQGGSVFTSLPQCDSAVCTTNSFINSWHILWPPSLCHKHHAWF